MIIMDGDIRLSAVLERAGTEPGPLVIFLHGFTANKDRPHSVAACEAMREAGFSTLRVDLYGHGESGGTFREHTLDRWLSNTFAVLDRAERLAWVTEIWLSGHSQGGLTAALAAGMAPERIRGLILRAPAFMIPRCAREGTLLGRSFDPAHIPDEIDVIKGLTLSGAYLRAARTYHPEEAVDRFPGPVLLLHGDLDDVVPVGDSVKAAARYARGTLRILHGEGHHFEHTLEMQRIIRDWLLLQRGAVPPVILLNGPSSSGKSTLARALRALVRERLAMRYDIISIDDYMRVPPGETIYEDDVFEISDDLCRGALDALRAGSGVIIDHVMTSERIDRGLREALQAYPMAAVRVTCPPDILRKREAERGDRCPGSAEASDTYLYPKDGYDLTVDTGALSPARAAERIYARFFTGHVG